MKVICIHDEVWDRDSARYATLKLRNLTKGKVYNVVSIIDINKEEEGYLGIGKHYEIDNGGLYFHSRFAPIVINSNISIL